MKYALLLSLTLLLFLPVTAAAQTLQEALENAPPIIRVEEDWEIKIGEPLPDEDLPQIVTVFGPTDANFGTHTVFELNHGTQPDFIEGGMQLQVWWSNYLVGHKAQFAPNELSQAGEIIRYRTVTRLSDHTLTMEIVNGTSATWGPFGNENLLQLKMITLREHLNPYDPENSLVHSRVTFGANRVHRFVRTGIRFYSSEGLYVESTTKRYVHRLSVDVEAEALEASQTTTSP